MNDATQKLTRDLRNISARKYRSQSAKTPRKPFSAAQVGQPAGVDEFLRKRKEFEKQTRGLYFGQY